MICWKILKSQLLRKYKLFEEIFIKDYFRNPFFWWGITILFLTTFNADPNANFILQTIIFYTLYVPILFGCLTIAFFLVFYPIRKSLRKLYLKNGKETIVYCVLLCCVLFIHVIYFLADPPFIFSKLYSQVITNKETFKEAIDLKTLIEYLGIPLLYAFSTTVVKRRLLKEDFEIKDKFTNNLKFGAYLILVNTAMYFLYTFIRSFQQ